MSEYKKLWFLEERLIFGLVIIVSLLGVFTWFNINEQEDPFFPYRNGQVVIVAPGMSASAIEDTIVQPFERLLANVDGIERVSSKSSDSFALVQVELQETIYDTEKAWQRVREKVSEASAKYSTLVSQFELNDRVQDTDGILLNIESTMPLLETRQYALYVRDELYKISDIRKVDIIGDPSEQVEVFFPQELMIELGISPQNLANQIKEANSLKSTGVLKGNLYQSNISSVTRLNDIEALKSIEIETPDKRILTLSDIAQVRTVIPPIDSESFWLDGKRAIGLSIVVPPNELRVTDFGEHLKDKIKQLNAQNSQFTITPVFFQPEWTGKRRNDLALSLLYSSIGVGVVLFLLMSKKVALVVTLTIPAIALSAIAIFGMWGGVLHQMSIAGLIISLGLMVDNSIVMSELISRFRQQGYNNIEASFKAIKALYRPLATSTFTTIAAFVPMLLSKGNVADFIRMIPVIVIIAILTSYVYSLALLPAITNNLKNLQESGNSSLFETLGQYFSRLGTRYSKFVIVGFAVLIGLSITLTNNEGGEFFPKSNRNQVVIDIEGSIGLSHSATLQTVKKVEAIVSEKDYTNSVISFVGNSGPSFYYNLSTAPNEPNVARVVIETSAEISVPEVVNQLNELFSHQFKSTRVWAREIGQGPPIDAPIAMTVLGENRHKLLEASEEIFSVIDKNSYTVDTRRSYVVAKPTLSFKLDEYNLHQVGIKRSDISDFIAWRTIGFNATNIPRDRDSVNVVIRDNQTIESIDAQYVMNTMIINNKGEHYPLSLFASPEFIGESPSLTRWRGFNSQEIKSEVIQGVNPTNVIESLHEELLSIAQKHNVTLELDGVSAEKSDSNAALLKNLPIGVLLLLGALILQFNSYRLAGLVMLTIPLAMIGVFPTLSLVGVNFGFMSVLGLLALTGIVVNTAIILIDSVLVKIKEEGLFLVDAIEHATRERFRPVILTACTTIVGMIPLTSPSSPLWPPMAWTIIGGLLTSTILTLIVLPAFLSLVLSEEKIRGIN